MRYSLIAVLVALSLAGCAGSQSQMRKSSDEAPAAPARSMEATPTPAPVVTPAPTPTRAPSPRPTVKPTTKPTTAPTRR